ncbi:hypothetical protein QFC19_000350 [Naganishia cerealis]|uniref:Uncharacterized protein n=1 Tax=Naganishia cerealis TaxID=610337 RepID=A0ACC2WQI5_9TREE|nr:hypothetical protein QFC19_000350 [Naganishia cerealis]
MAGSQLKQLRASLKEKGLVGQTNVKRKNKNAKTPSETRRQDHNKIISEIRNDFNQFDNRYNRTKHDVTTILKGKFVKVGSKQHNEASRNNQSVEQALKSQHEAKKKFRGRTGGLVDRRFGEGNANMTAEEKMLIRFARERESGNKKKHAFSLGSDDEEDGAEDDDDGFVLTHGGKAIADEESLGDQVTYADENSAQPLRRKSKAEVMKEVIAKSKFYKQQRQKEFAKTQDEIMDLDEDFGDVMQVMNEQPVPKQPIKSKTAEEIEYDSRVRELTYDRRAVPADRTKTDEELRKEHAEKMRKLEEEREKRMLGFASEGGDNIDDDFWENDQDEDEMEGVSIENGASSDSDEELETEVTSKSSKPKAAKHAIPSTQTEFISIVEGVEPSQQPRLVNSIVESHHPRLAAGNKEKMDVFVGILFQHVLYLADKDKELTETYISILVPLAENYNQALVENVRTELQQVQNHILDQKLRTRDLVLFAVIGVLFSTSDHYHLVVTPALILMNEAISSTQFRQVSLKQLAEAVYLSDMVLHYQRIAKRYVPEVACFLQRALMALVPQVEKLGGKPEFNLKPNDKRKNKVQISISGLSEDSPDFKFSLLDRILELCDRSVSMWRDNSGIVEITAPLIPILTHLARYFNNELTNLAAILTKIVKLHENAVKERVPLALQTHKALAIPTYAPKFEENFNPDKKSYDANRERQEINKMKHQLKKEKKLTMKDIRKQGRFSAREQIRDKKQMYEEYHKKMANIVSSISTTEGAEKNAYEREKKKRAKK